MTDENETGGGEESPPESKTNARDDRRRETLTKRATAAEAARIAAETRANELEDQIAELSGKSGNYDKMVERLQSKLAKAEQDRDHALSEASRQMAGVRTGSLVERLAAEAEIPASRVRGLLLAAKADDPDLDIAPDRIEASTLKSFKSILAEIDPDSFRSAETGKARPRPGPAPAAHARGLAQGERPAQDALAALLSQPLFSPPPGRER